MGLAVYVGMAGSSIAVLLLVQLLDIPRLSAAERATGGRPLPAILRQPAYRVALASSMFGYAVMTLTMSATPLAMQACGFAFLDSATVIQMHIIGMFLPSFFTGHLDRALRRAPIIATGGVIEFAVSLVNLAGVDFANFSVANILVGLGWNFAYVGGSTLLTTTYAPAERAKVQASHDFTVYTATATSAALSGVLQAKAGWIVINLAAVPLMAVVVGAALWLMAQQRRVGRRRPPNSAECVAHMGDRYDRDRKKGLHPALRGLKPPSEIIAWGLTRARIGHNQGPPLEEPVADAFVRWRWRKAHQEAWKNPPLSILQAARRARRGRRRDLPRIHAGAARHRPPPAGRPTSPSGAASADALHPLRLEDWPDHFADWLHMAPWHPALERHGQCQGS